ncbi:hypothetical protein, partial [Cupriavidus necator]|uniref:hypothetical protein n=1 Tax=Cupriavidus necator TaxID=106590 RepID=UPI001C71048A
AVHEAVGCVEGGVLKKPSPVLFPIKTCIPAIEALVFAPSFARVLRNGVGKRLSGINHSKERSSSGKKKFRENA